MRALAGIEVVHENGIFRVSADFASGFVLVPAPDGKMNLFFWEKNRMKRFLRHHGFAPAISPVAKRVN